MFELDQTTLKTLLSYDPATGWFRWLSGRQGINGLNVRAGTVSHGGKYRKIQVLCRQYMEHRLAFLYMTGSIPDEVDHDNLDGTDNRWLNLRIATTSQNCANKTKYITNTSGYKGVSWDSPSSKWRAQITYQNQVEYLGLFNTKEAASQAYTDRAKELFSEFARI